MALNFQNRESSPLNRILLIAFIVLAIGAMTLYVREGDSGVLHRAQAAFQSVVAPVKSVGFSTGTLAQGAATSLEDATASDETLSALRERNAELTELVVQAEEYRLEAQRLQELLKLKDTYDVEGVAARVIGRSTDAWNQTITIDAGSSSGVETGLSVIGPSGVIGQVVSVSGSAATVRLLTDPQSGAAAMVQSSRAEGVVRGSLNGLLYLENIDADVVVNVGDVVLTSGLGGSYTRGLLIGTVVRIEGSASDATRRVVVAQNEDVLGLEEVIVVKSAGSQDGGQSGAQDGQDGQASQGSQGDGQ